MSRLVLAFAAAASIAGYTFVYTTGRAETPIRSDGFSYYVYLPSWFLFHDPSLAATARDCCGGEFPAFTAIGRWPGTRRWVNAHPIGVAVMQAPLFAAAHALTRWTNLSPDGFSLYYQHAAGLSGTLWMLAGLWVLRGLLGRHFSDRVTAITLLTLLFGTNLYHYATVDSTYSHAYSFFLFAAFLDITERWHARPGTRLSLALGFVAGLIVLVRHTNGLVLLVFPLYGVTGWRSLRERLPMLRAHLPRLAMTALVFAAVVAPQLAIYHAATGHWLVSAYGELGFNWRAPRIVSVLFGVQKGLFFWSPLLLAAGAGLVLLGRSPNAARAFVLPGVVFLALDTYVIASWWDWQFGGSYGHRGFVDALPIFALGLAAFYSWASVRPLRRAATSVVVACVVSLSVFQMLQYLERRAPVPGSFLGSVPHALSAGPMIRRSLVLLVALSLAGAALAYLRDPPWLLATTSGLGGWETGRDSTRYRWTNGHASFFVPADWTAIELPLRATFESPADWPIAATVTIDDRPADRVVLSDDSWRHLLIRLPPRPTRRVRRIDIRLDRTRDGNLGVQLGEIGHR